MKKTLLLSAFALCICKVNAQTLLVPYFSNKITWSPMLKPKTTNDLLKTPTIAPRLTDFPINGVKKMPDALPMRYMMPIAKVSSNDRMPVVITDEPGMHYDMLIKRMGTFKQDSTVKIVP